MKHLIMDILEFFDFIDSLIKKICIFLAGLMVLTVVLQVVCRYVLQSSLLWTEELSRYLLIWLAFLGGSSLVRLQENMFVDFFVNKLPPRLLTIVKRILNVVIIIFLFSILWYAVRIYPKVSARQVTPALQVSIFYIQVSVIVGVILMILQSFNILLSDIVKREVVYG